MEIGLELFIHAMDSLKPSFVIHDNELASGVRRAELFADDQHAMRPDSLYVMDKTQAEGLSDDLCANILMVGATKNEKMPPSCNCVLVPGAVNLSELIQLLGACTSALTRFDACCVKLLSALVAGDGLNELMDIVAAGMGNPVVMMRIPGVAIAHSQQVETDDTLWNRLVYEGGNIMEEADLFDGYIPLDLYQGLEHPRYFVQPPWKRRIMMGIWISGSCDHVLTILENDKRFDKSDELLSELMAQVLSSALQRSQDVEESPGAVFGRLVSQEPSLTEQTMRKLSNLGFPIERPWRMALFESDSHEGSYLDQIRFLGRLRDAIPGRLVFSHGDYAVAFADISDDKKLFSLFDQSKGENGWSMGISMPFFSLRDIGAAYEQCRKCLLACRSEHVQKIMFEEVLLEDFYQSAIRCGAGEEHILPVAERIVKYDEDCETEYAHTLWTHLKNFCDKNATAADLFIHRNSVTYRLEKIESLFGVDLGDIHALRTLELSFELLHAQGRI